MKFQSKPIEEHEEVPLADDGRWEDLVEYWSNRESKKALGADGDSACYVVSLVRPDETADEDAQLDEILGLVQAQGDRVAGHEIRRLLRIDPRTLVGKGACEEIADQARAHEASVLVFDAELSPSQMRNLEDATGFPIADRECVILNVFLRHAKSRRARIQVEIAQLEYLRPRIRGLGIDMDQQAGGVKRARGPGETASELLARRLDKRLADLRRSFSRLVASGELQRRRRSSTRRVALVGYTNAGKTSLMNALTAAGLSARDRPFETLDTTSRCLTRHGGEVLISDTVGFIRRMPERLLASFESTLAEAQEASLVVVVVDVSDPERLLHLQTTEAMLRKLGADTLERLYVFNKIDRLPAAPPVELLRALSRGHQSVGISSFDDEGVRRLKEALIRSARGAKEPRVVFVPYAASEILSSIYARAQVVEAKAMEDGMLITLDGDPEVVARIEQAIGELSQC